MPPPILTTWAVEQHAAYQRQRARERAATWRLLRRVLLVIVVLMAAATWRDAPAPPREPDAPAFRQPARR